MRGIFFYIPLLFFCAIFVGCQSKTVGVTGKVSFDGETGENIRVLFQPITAAAVVPEAAVGMTDRSGRFTMCLAESKKNGVLPGEYAVYI